MLENIMKRGLRKFHITSSYQLAKKTGLSEVQAARLWKGDQLPSLATVVIVCDALGNGCEMWDMVRRTKPQARRNGASKPKKKRTKG